MRQPRQSPVELEMLILSLLSRGSLSGYDLATLLSGAVPYIWPVKRSQIYPALAQLEGRMDVEGDWLEQTGRPNKKNYRPTEQGRVRLVAWLSQPREAPSYEVTILAAYNCALIGKATALAVVDAYRRQAELEIAALEARWSEIASSAIRLDGGLGPRSAFEFAIVDRRARLSWCDWFAQSAHAQRG